MQSLKITHAITNRESQTFTIYLREISKQPLLTVEEEVDLACKIKMGNGAALDRLVNGNLRFVVSVAKQFSASGLPLPDLVNEGNIGLIHAAKLFDETKGFKFISYAIWWIRQHILKAIAAQKHIVHYPIKKIMLSLDIEKEKKIWQQQHQREPWIKELSEVLHKHVYEIIEASALSLRHVSIDAPAAIDRDESFGDTLESVDIDRPDAGISTRNERIIFLRTP